MQMAQFISVIRGASAISIFDRFVADICVASVLFSRVLGGTAAHECNSSSRLLQLGPHPIPRRGMRALLRDIRFVYFAIRFYEKFPGCKPFEQTTTEQLKISSKQKSA